MTAAARRPKLAVTAGEPAGIGPDLCLWLAQQTFDADITVLTDASLLQQRAMQCALIGNNALDIVASHNDDTLQLGNVTVLHHPVAETVTAGQLNKANAQHVLSLLDTAMQGCESGQFDAMVTAPLQKSVINEAGIPFTGHTEYLAEYFQCQTVMMLTADTLRVALATTHLPLSAVPAAITQPALEQTLLILLHDLQNKFGLQQPTVLVCGLNPHAGENGHMGREEIDVISPVLNKLRQQGHNVVGPLPADTLFVPKHLAAADAVLAMYHDQGLPVLKHVGFGAAVNITLGLPIIRTSVDHGTALDLAGSANIDTGSMKAAILSAIQQCQARRH